MNISLKQIRAFLAVAEARSFAEACAQVHLSQPALSIAIRNLEDAVGGQLLARTTRTLALTPEGESFLPVARRLLNDWDNAFTDLHNLFAMQRGKLTIAAMPSFAANQLPHAFVHYRRQYPAINIAVEDVVAENVVDLVRSGRVELGISFDPGREDDLEFEPLFEDRFVAVLPTDHSLAERNRVSWQSLAGFPFLALQRPSSIRSQIENTLAEAGIALPVELEAHQLATIGRMVACNLGVSAVPSLCIEQMEAAGAVCRPLANPSVSREVGILTRRRYPLSAAARAMVDTLRTHISS